MVRSKEVLLVQPPLLLVMVKVTRPPLAISFGPKTYVGVVVVPLVPWKLPSPPVMLHDNVP
jgi:hypothetical protein